MNPRTCAAYPAVRLRRSNPDAAEEWSQRDFDRVGETPNHPVFIQRDDLHALVGKVIRKKAGARSESIVGIWDGELNRFDPYFQHITGFSAFYEDQARENGHYWSFVR